MQHRLVKLLGAPAPWLMGVVNVTPDSFTDGGRFLAPDAAAAHGRQLLADGAHLLDLGGESTAPGSRPITGEEELRRLEPVVRALAPAAILSIDTYHAATAARCLELGAAIVNDVSALRADPEMAAVVRDLRPGAGDDAREGRPAAARDRPAGPLPRRGARGRRLAGGPRRRGAGRRHRGQPARARPRLGQVPQPRPGPHLGAAGPVRRAGRRGWRRSRC